MGAFDDIAPIVLPDPNDATKAEAFRKKWGWEPHEQVILKGQITVADQEYVTNHYGQAKKKGDIDFQIGTGRFAILDRLIMDWTFSRSGVRVPVTPANIRKLPANYSNAMLEVIDALAQSMSEEEQEDFFTSANGHIVDASDSMSLLPTT